MESLNTVLHSSKFNSSISIIERSQVQILAIGYQIVMLKSKLKKQFKILISALSLNF